MNILQRIGCFALTAAFGYYLWDLSGRVWGHSDKKEKR